MLPMRHLKNESVDAAAHPMSRRRRWGKWLLRLGVVAVVGLCIVTVAFVLFYQKILTYGVGIGLDKAGLTGEFAAQGSLFSYLELKDVDVSGEGMVQSLLCDRARIDYQLWSLITSRGKRGLDLVTLRGVDLVLDKERKVPKDASAQDKEKLPKSFSDKLSYLKYSAIDAANIDVRYHFERGEVVTEGVKLEWNPKLRSGSVGFDRVSAPSIELEDNGLNISIAETWNAIEFSNFRYKEGLVVKRLTMSGSSSEKGWEADAELQCLEASLNFHFIPSKEREMRLSLEQGELDLKLLEERLGLPKVKLPKAVISKLALDFSGDPKTPATWNGSLAMQARSLEFGKMKVDSLGAVLRFKDGRIEMPELNAQAKASRLKMTADIDLSRLNSAKKIRWITIPASGTLTLHSQDLGDLVATSGRGGKILLGGAVDADLSWALDNGELRGLSGPVSGSELVVASAKIMKLDVTCDSTMANQVDVAGTIDFDADNRVSLDGSYAIRSGDYNATASLKSGSLAGLRARITEVAEDAKPLTGQADLTLSATGNTKDAVYSLTGEADVSNLVMGAADPLAISAAFTHSPERSAVTDCRVTTGELLLSLDAALGAGRLTVPRLSFSSAENGLIAGSLAIPCDPAVAKSAHEFLKQLGDVTASLSIKRTSFSDLFRIAGKEAAGVTGSVEGSLKVGGVLADPVIEAVFDFSDLGLAGKKGEIEPASATLRMSAMNHRLAIDGRVVQAEIEPLVISGRVPLLPVEWTAPDQDSALNEEIIDFTVRLPETSLKKLEQMVPAISLCEGSISADVVVSGKVGAPLVTGAAHVSIPQLKFHQPELPYVKNMVCHVQFDKHIVQLQTFQGTAAGGAFNGSGSVDLSDTSDPVLDFKLAAEEALFYRTEDLSVRSNIAITLTGPVSAAQVKANVELVNSRYQKEIDLLPIALPENGPKMPVISGPRAARLAPKVGIQSEPLANWDFDVHFTTRDPFLVIGNLATSEVIADMHIAGKGRSLRPTGEVRLENAKATLPFCTLNIDAATLSFLPATGFNPKISVDGDAEVGEYQIRVHVYSSLLNPEYILTSNPPLAEEDIISLIVTGATREQLETSGSGQAVAKGGKLLLEKLRQDMGLSTAEQMLIPRNLTFDIGGVNERTGEPTATAKLKLRERIFVLGNVDTEGQYRGVLKWAIRFR
ncbi:MAG: autotransporter translocation and assembly factor TamB [Verrucomicrobiales bacterium]|jgi:autotransporter translocation and assembly factor TamB